MTKITISIVAAIILTILPAVLQGRFVNRWGTPPDLDAAAQRLGQFPRVVGAWQNVEDERPLSDAVCRELGLVQHFHRSYTHTRTGDRLEVLLMVGPPGRLVRHPPDVCYSNRANRQIGVGQSIAIGSEVEEHEFRLLHFRTQSEPTGGDFCVAYAYSTNRGLWTVPSSPRMAFGAEPGLYKLQVLVEGASETEQNLAQGFLEKFVAAFPIALADGAAEGNSEIGSLSTDGGSNE